MTWIYKLGVLSSFENIVPQALITHCEMNQYKTVDFKRSLGTTLALAGCKFPVSKFLGVCFTFQQCFSRAGMDNRMRDVICMLARTDYLLSNLLWSSSLCSSEVQIPLLQVSSGVLVKVKFWMYLL